MDESVQTLSAQHNGLVPAAELRKLGVGSRAADSLVGRGQLARIRRGMYADNAVWGDADVDERYRLLVRSTAMLSERPMVLSHLSAAAMHGLPKIGAWPKTVHTVDPRPTGGSAARFITNHRGGPAAPSVPIAGVVGTSLARTLVDVAATSPFLVGVGMVDHALRVERERVETGLRRGICEARALTKEDLYAELAAVNPRTGGRRAASVIDFSNDLAANLGESLSRVRIFELGFEVPELQVCFRNIGGRNYWVDFFWRRIRKIGEFDGKHKYTRGAILGDRDPGETVWVEKQREDALRFHSDSFDRWDWEIAISPRQFYNFLVEHGVPRA